MHPNGATENKLSFSKQDKHICRTPAVTQICDSSQSIKGLCNLLLVCVCSANTHMHTHMHTACTLGLAHLKSGWHNNLQGTMLHSTHSSPLRG